MMLNLMKKGHVIEKVTQKKMMKEGIVNHDNCWGSSNAYVHGGQSIAMECLIDTQGKGKGKRRQRLTMCAVDASGACSI